MKKRNKALLITLSIVALIFIFIKIDEKYQRKCTYLIYYKNRLLQKNKVVSLNEEFELQSGEMAILKDTPLSFISKERFCHDESQCIKIFQINGVTSTEYYNKVAYPYIVITDDVYHSANKNKTRKFVIKDYLEYSINNCLNLEKSSVYKNKYECFSALAETMKDGKYCDYIPTEKYQEKCWDKIK